jgi:hypothetical protein
MKSNFKIKLNANELDAIKLTRNVFEIQSMVITDNQDFDLIKKLIYSQMIEVYKKIERLYLQLEFQKYGLEKNFVMLNLTYGQAISFYLFLTKYPIPQNDMYLLNVLQSMISEINVYLN